MASPAESSIHPFSKLLIKYESKTELTVQDTFKISFFCWTQKNME